MSVRFVALRFRGSSIFEIFPRNFPSARYSCARDKNAHSGRPAAPIRIFMRPYRYPAVSPLVVFIRAVLSRWRKNRQPPGARLTEKSQKHGELLNGSLMLPVGCSNRPSLFGFPPCLPPSVSFACPSSFVFFSSSPFLASASPFFRFDHLHSRARVCVCAAEVSRLRSFYSWSYHREVRG